MRLLLALLLLLPATAHAQAVPRVVDGDTVRWQGRLVRMAHIDAPELRRPRCLQEERLARRATDRLAVLVARGVVVREARGHDRYGRLLATLETRDGRDIGAILIAERLAVPYEGRGPRQDWCRPGAPAP